MHNHILWGIRGEQVWHYSCKSQTNRLGGADKPFKGKGGERGKTTLPTSPLRFKNWDQRSCDAGAVRNNKFKKRRRPPEVNVIGFSSKPTYGERRKSPRLVNLLKRGGEREDPRLLRAKGPRYKRFRFSLQMIQTFLTGHRNGRRGK